MHKCRVPGCTSVSQLVRFPKHEDQLQKWVSVIQNPILENMSIGLLYKIERICVDHFEKKYFSNESTIINKILLDEAIPTLSLPGTKENIKCIAHQNISQNTVHNSQNQVISHQFAKRLKETILNLPALDRICVLLFKTVKLSPKLVYNTNYDMIFGWQNVNTNHKNAFAKKAIVFMVRGLYSNWKQMISFVFCDEKIENETLIQSLKDVVITCFSLRLKIVATVCEETRFNIDAMNLFSKQSHANCLHDDDEFGYQSFTINNHEIIVLYDVLHLFKTIKHDFRKNNLDGDCYLFFVRLFGSLDGSTKTPTTALINDLKKNVTFTSGHWDLWEQNIETLQNFKINKKILNVQQWITTVFGIMQIWRGILQRSNFKSFSPKFLQLRELNKVVQKIHSHKKEPIRYMDYDEISYSKYLKNISNKINSKTRKKNCNSFVKSFKKQIINFNDNSLPLCDATRPLLFEKIQQFTDKDFNDYDYRNLDLGMSNSAKPLLSAPEFFEFDYEPVLFSDNSKLNNWTLNKNQIFKMIPLIKIKNFVVVDMVRVLIAINCNDCNKMYHGKIPENNFMKIFAEIIAAILTALPKFYNKPKIIENLSEVCGNVYDFDFKNCVEHNLLDVFVKFCIHYVIKFFVLRINRKLTKNCGFYSNMDLVSKQAVLIGRKRTSRIKKNNRIYFLCKKIKK